MLVDWTDYKTFVQNQVFLTINDGIDCCTEHAQVKIYPFFNFLKKNLNVFYITFTLVLCKVYDAKPLPVESEMSPAKFNIPEDHKIQPEVESSSESTSRETTPESDDSDDDDDDGDEDEELADQDDDDNKVYIGIYCSTWV